MKCQSVALLASRYKNGISYSGMVLSGNGECVLIGKLASIGAIPRLLFCGVCLETFGTGGPHFPPVPFILWSCVELGIISSTN